MGAGLGHARQNEGVLMRRSVLLAVPVLLLANTARAQTVVICPTCTQEIPAALNYVSVLARWAQQFQQMEAQYQQLVETYESLHHLNAQSLTTAAGLLGHARHLPGSAAAELPGLNYGANLSGAAQQFYNQNHYYTPEGEDWNALEMKRRQYATANLQGEAQISIEAIEHRLAGLTELQNSIPEQPDVTAVAAINARISSEQAFLANETNHIQQLQLLQQTQTHVDQQRAEQRSRELSDKWDAAVAPQAWGH
jgi:hypothetical protein